MTKDRILRPALLRRPFLFIAAFVACIPNLLLADPPARPIEFLQDFDDEARRPLFAVDSTVIGVVTVQRDVYREGAPPLRGEPAALGPLTAIEIRGDPDTRHTEIRSLNMPESLESEPGLYAERWVAKGAWISDNVDAPPFEIETWSYFEVTADGTRRQLDPASFTLRSLNFSVGTDGEGDLVVLVDGQGSIYAVPENSERTPSVMQPIGVDAGRVEDMPAPGPSEDQSERNEP